MLCVLLATGCDRAQREPVSVSVNPEAGIVVLAQAEPGASDTGTSSTTPEVPPVVDRQTFDDHIVPFFQEHCVGCHGPETAEQELRLDQLTPDFVDRLAADLWVEVLNRINLGEMPPEDEPRPSAESLAIVTDWITSELQLVQQRSQSTGGRVLLRRLTRREYANTVRDLLHVEFVEGEGPLDVLPPDGSIGGFDTVSRGLLLDPSLMDAYLSVARQVADRAVEFRPPLVPTRTMRFEFRNTPDSAMASLLEGRQAYLDGDLMAIMEGGARTYAKLRHPFNNREIPVTGEYRIRVRAAADPGERDDPIYMDVSFGSVGRLARFRVDAPANAPQVYEFEEAFDAAVPGEFQVHLVEPTRFGNHQLEWLHEHRQMQDLFDAGQLLESTRMRARMRAEGSYDTYTRGAYETQVLHLERLPKLYVEWIEVTGPLQPEFPPASMHALFPSGWAAEQLTLESVRDIFAALLPRAFRRPVSPAEVEALVRLVERERGYGENFESSLETGLAAMLCAPDFLYVFEPASDPESEPLRELNDHELAARVSYFLWSSLPDEELFRLAVAGRLHERATLTGQVDRMLADPKAEGFVQGFARQWLKIDEFDRFPPDEQIFPAYYATEMVGLPADIQEQPLAFFRELLESDASVVSLLDSDWTMLNERLALYYGIDGVSGNDFRRVELPSESEREGDDASTEPAGRRGGLLGMAGVHQWGSDGNRTKPVERGKYVLDVLFNDPPPPPPPNAGEVEPNLAGQRFTVRERLARHREQPTCNNCHRRIDPWGLALENFNVIGQWRDRLDGEKPLPYWGADRPPIEPGGTLPNGREFGDFREFKQALLEQQDRFLRGLAEKLFVYALGRTLEPSDRPTIDSLVAQAQAGDASLRSLILGIVLSAEFARK